MQPNEKYLLLLHIKNTTFIICRLHCQFKDYLNVIISIDAVFKNRVIKRLPKLSV